MYKIKNSIPLIIFLFLFSPLFAKAQSVDDANFNPNYIIGDAEMLDSTAMNLDDIQQFLENKGSYLANYSCLNADGIVKKASEIIYDAAENNYDCDGVQLSDNPTLAEKQQKCKKISINPKLLLVLLQKEEGLVEDPSPKQTQLDWATGYGCFDGEPCSLHWKGFGKQLNSAALQFYDYMINPQYYTYQVGQTYTVSNTNKDPMTVTPADQATAALYNYTPHVYNGNYNFYILWQKYFTKNYLDGSLLQAKDEPGVWLIQDGMKRPFLSKAALLSRFDPNKIITVDKSDLDKYEKGTPIKFPQYSLIRSPRGTIFLLVDNYRHGITSDNVFKEIGFNPEEVVDASWDDVNSYQEGAPITATSTYPTGALLQDDKTGGVYWVINGTKAPVWDKVLFGIKFQFRKIIPVSPKELQNYTTVDPVTLDDGDLIKSPDSSAVYVISDGQKRAFMSGDVFEGLGYKWQNIIPVNEKLFNAIPEGDPITSIQGNNNSSSTDSSDTSLNTISSSTASSTVATTTSN